MTLHESLSRLLDGDLDPEAAAALHARIRAEPGVAKAWAAMNRLPAAFAALPDEAPPMPTLSRPASPRRSRTAGWVLTALAAGFGAALLLPRERPELVLDAGTSVVDGHVDALVGDLRITVDGESVITVEPSAGLLRDAGPEVPMDRSHLLSALVGAAVSLTVNSGTAVLTAPGEEPVTVATGQTRTVGAPQAQAPAPAKQGDDPRIAALEAELTGLKLQRALQQAQLNGVNGTPVQFPANLPAAFSPAEFERNVRDGLRGKPGVELLSMNCEEYPCIAVLRTSNTGADWGQDLSALGSSIRDEAYGEDAGIHEDSELRHGPDGDLRVMAFSTTAPGSEDENTGTRRAYRVKQLMDALGDPDE